MVKPINFSKLEGFEWDEANINHIAKHEVGPQEFEQAFINEPLLVSEDQTHSKVEKRWKALGKTGDQRLLFIVFTIRNRKIRPISARNQNRKEKTIFQEAGGERN